MRPGELRERHIWQVPVVGQRQVPRTFLGLPFGTRTEKYAESHEEKVEDIVTRHLNETTLADLMQRKSDLDESMSIMPGF